MVNALLPFQIAIVEKQGVRQRDPIVVLMGLAVVVAPQLVIMVVPTISFVVGMGHALPLRKLLVPAICLIRRFPIYLTRAPFSSPTNVPMDSVLCLPWLVPILLKPRFLAKQGNPYNVLIR